MSFAAIGKSQSAGISPCSLNHQALPCQCQSDPFTCSYVESLFRHRIQPSLFPTPSSPKNSLQFLCTPEPLLHQFPFPRMHLFLKHFSYEDHPPWGSLIVLFSYLWHQLVSLDCKLLRERIFFFV